MTLDFHPRETPVTGQESISSMKREMMRAGLIEEMLDEGMEEMVSWHV